MPRTPCPKAAAAARRLARINSSTRVHGLVEDLTPSNIDELLAGVALILDGTDNFETRYLINDYSVSRGIPWIYGAAVGSYGLTMPVVPGRTACLRCVYPDPPSGTQPTCDTAGVLNVAASAVASLQVAAALKVLCGDLDNLSARITTIDVWTGAIRQSGPPQRDPDCPACGRGEFPYLENLRREPARLCGRNAVQVNERPRPIDLAVLQARLAPLGDVRANEFALRFFPTPYEMTVFPDGRAIIKGTSDTGVARSLYARYVG